MNRQANFLWSEHVWQLVITLSSAVSTESRWTCRLCNFASSIYISCVPFCVINWKRLELFFFHCEMSHITIWVSHTLRAFRTARSFPNPGVRKHSGTFSIFVCPLSYNSKSEPTDGMVFFFLENCVRDREGWVGGRVYEGERKRLFCCRAFNRFCNSE